MPAVAVAAGLMPAVAVAVATVVTVAVSTLASAGNNPDGFAGGANGVDRCENGGNNPGCSGGCRVQRRAGSR